MPVLAPPRGRSRTGTEERFNAKDGEARPQEERVLYTRTRDETGTQAAESSTRTIGTGSHFLRSHRDVVRAAPTRVSHHGAMRYRKL